MNVEFITIAMFGTMFLFLITGLPLAFGLGAIGLAFSIWLWGGPAAATTVVFTTYGVMRMFLLIAVPLFIFLGIILERSGIADDLYDTIYKWMGGLKGGLGMGTIIICAIIAAMVGVSGAATVTMGFIALPSMVKRGYNKRMVTGAIQAGGALGFLIPPSVVAIIYGMIARISVGKLFAAGVGPGLMLAIFYMIYIGVRCRLQPEMGPAIPPEQRVSWKEKFISLRGLILPVILIATVLGLIVLGVTSPTEASAVGAGGALICAAIHRRLTWQVFHESVIRTARVTAIIMWVVVGALAFSTVYDGLGAAKMVEAFIRELPFGSYGVLILIQLSFFVLGCFLDDTAILFVTMPVYLPLVTSLGFDPVWFGILYIVNMQMAFLTPPFGYCLFYMLGIVKDLYRTGTIPEEITIGDVYRSVWPYVAMQGFGLIMVIIFPKIAMWLPNLFFQQQ
jgi:tripartite ATP-independent transporter DctM subunit